VAKVSPHATSYGKPSAREKPPYDVSSKVPANVSHGEAESPARRAHAGLTSRCSSRHGGALRRIQESGEGLTACDIIRGIVRQRQALRIAWPDAKSVSERIWYMSHHVRPNPAHRSHAFVSPSLPRQEVARLFPGYHAWQPSHGVRPDTLATP
jgi:hypothetical protein